MALGSYQTSSNSTYPSSSEAINSKDAPAVIESALETISASDLVHLLAKAGRLGYRETDVVEDDAGDPLVHEVYKGRGRAGSTLSPHPSLFEASREPKRQKTDECESLRKNGPPRTTAHPAQPGRTLVAKYSSDSVKRRRGGTKIQKQRFTSATIDRSSRPGLSTKVGPVLDVKDPVPRSGNPVKRPHIQCSVGPFPSSDAKQSQGVSLQHVELIVIVDTEPESSEDDENQAEAPPKKIHADRDGRWQGGLFGKEKGSG
ncbi:hypothetical protein OIDMADRAFT_149972 [Oidiodendron maius Zn]|uniref:Uncharacterized protein n=1 Tax=Oidiodendron maius (strain Zn) TaxID=913774 RepID=A0A0C3G968_OIDMZ|nr:hypothetical protein OIDMADRAFT_149972 [Oidiodendron maius Zn]